MAFDATFWVAVSFIIFFGALIYFKIPQNVNNLLGKMIVDIRNEIDESEKLRTESKKLLENAQKRKYMDLPNLTTDRKYVGELLYYFASIVAADSKISFGFCERIPCCSGSKTRRPGKRQEY